MTTVRVAACQFAIDVDVDQNLGTVLRMVDGAAAAGAQLAVLPEFCNHPSWYRDEDHAWEVAVDLEGDFINAVAVRAAGHRMWVMVNATVRRDGRRITDTNVLIDSDGRVVSTSDKHVLMGAERVHIAEGQGVAPIVHSPFGRLATYSCMDGVINETPRCLALRGAQVLLNSLNSFALDEASLHVPVRAAENRVWVVAANKVGPLLPAATMAEVSAGIGVDPKWLEGAGESQIVAPDGRVVAIGPRTGEAVVVADIEVELADDKSRPDGTDVFASRRPVIYGPIGAPPAGIKRSPGLEDLPVAAVQPATPEDAVTLAARAIADGARLVVLPELAAGWFDDPLEAARSGQALVDRLQGICADAVIVTTVARAVGDAWSHVAVAVGRDGVVLEQPQLHPVARHPWGSVLGDHVAVAELPWGRLALVVGDDALYPETMRLAAIAEAEVVALPTDIQESWELRTGLVERAAENRVNIVAASRPGAAGASAIIAAQTDFTLWTNWQRPFAGSINYPDVATAAPGASILMGVVHPATTANRFVSRGTDVVDGRPWRLVQAITDPIPAGGSPAAWSSPSPAPR